MKTKECKGFVSGLEDAIRRKLQDTYEEQAQWWDGARGPDYHLAVGKGMSLNYVLDLISEFKGGKNV